MHRKSHKMSCHLHHSHFSPPHSSGIPRLLAETAYLLIYTVCFLACSRHISLAPPLPSVPPWHLWLRPVLSSLGSPWILAGRSPLLQAVPLKTAAGEEGGTGKAGGFALKTTPSCPILNHRECPKGSLKDRPHYLPPSPSPPPWHQWPTRKAFTAIPHSRSSSFDPVRPICCIGTSRSCHSRSRGGPGSGSASWDTPEAVARVRGQGLVSGRVSRCSSGGRESGSGQWDAPAANIICGFRGKGKESMTSNQGPMRPGRQLRQGRHVRT